MKVGPGDSVLAARHLIGARVVDDGGKTLGHVIDMAIDPANDFQVVAVELGRHGWLDRVRALRPLAHDRLSKPTRVVDWKDIARFEDGRLICKPGAQVRRLAPPDDDEQPEAPARTQSGG